mgnify:CR=1 FL=1
MACVDPNAQSRSPIVPVPPPATQSTPCTATVRVLSRRRNLPRRCGGHSSIAAREDCRLRPAKVRCERRSNGGDTCAIMTSRQPLRAGIGGPVGSGKTALTLALCRALRDRYELAVVTNDIYTRERTPSSSCATRRSRRTASSAWRPAAARTPPSARMPRSTSRRWTGSPRASATSTSCSSKAAATISRRPSRPSCPDLTLYVIDVAAGDKIPRKGGPGITRSDLLVINKIDLAPMVGASLEVMDRDARQDARRAPVRVHQPQDRTRARHGRPLRHRARHGRTRRGAARDADRRPLAARCSRRSKSVHGRSRVAPALEQRCSIVPAAECAQSKRTLLVVKQWINSALSGAWHESCDAALRGRRAVVADARCCHRQSIDTGKSMQRRTVLKRLAASAALALAGLTVGTQVLAAEGTIKVGVLHSLSGTMAISETVLKDVDADGDRRDQRQGRRAWARSSRRSSSIRRRTGRCSPRRRAS